MARILLLEDDETLTEQLKEVLGLEGHVVRAFTDVPAALAHLDRAAVDLVIADIFIADPKGRGTSGGVTLISALKQVRRSSLPVIAISGAFTGNGTIHDSSGLVRETTATVGADALLAKPFMPQELLDLVSKYLPEE